MNTKDVNFMMNQIRIGGIQSSNKTTIKKSPSLRTSEKSFDEVLNQIKNSKEVSFSKHAVQRLKNRNIKLDKEDIAKLTNAVDKADKKGVKEALILMNQTAFIAHVKNRTIITAAMQEQLKENVFTNIDGAVIV